MSSSRQALEGIATQFESWTRAALSGAPVSFQDLVTQTASHEAALKKDAKDATPDLCIFLAASVGGFKAVDAYLRTHAKGATQSVMFRRVDIWGRLKAFEVLSQEFSDAFFGGVSSETERIKVSTALLREVRDISDLMMSELALRGEVTKLAAFLEWLTTASEKLNHREKALTLLKAG